MIRFDDWAKMNEQGVDTMTAAKTAQAARGLGGMQNLNRVNTAAGKTHAEGNPTQSAAVVEKVVNDVINGNDLPSQLAVIKTLKRLLTKFNPQILQMAAKDESGPQTMGNQGSQA